MLLSTEDSWHQRSIEASSYPQYIATLLHFGGLSARDSIAFCYEISPLDEKYESRENSYQMLLSEDSSCQMSDLPKTVHIVHIRLL